MSSNGPGNGELSPLKRALIAVERLQQRVRELEAAPDTDVAIVGASCRFPGGAHDLESFARLLRDGRDAITDRPPVPRPDWDRWERELGPFPPAGWLHIDVTAFDPAFFGISHREAASIDPQQRLALECAWEALEHAGVDPRSLEGSRTGVFVGTTSDDYAQVQLRSGPLNEVLHSHYASGIGKSMVAGRISYILGLQGPSIVLDTACSSSLVAVHLACQSLRSGESDAALAGGVSLMLSPEATVAFVQSRMLSSDGRCKTFDASADGFARGEGCGFLVLKRVTDAVRAGDRILAVIRGSAVNQDGASTGLTAPNGGAQEQVIRAALAQARLRGSEIDFVEAHGTGTSLGDPIEVQALAAALGADRPKERPLLISSVKTNVGHLEAAAGIAGLLRAVIAIRDRALPAHLHFRKPNPHVPWSRLPVEVPVSRRPFGPDGHRLRGGVSSFGFSGTNAHVIVEEAPPQEVRSSPRDRAVHVLPLSAHSPAALDELARAYADRLAAPDATLADIAHVAGAGRAQLGERAAVVAPDARSAAHALRSGALMRGRAPVEAPRVGLLFPGQGVQYAGMTRALYEAEPVFRAFMDRCDAVLREPLGRSLVELIHGDDVALQRTAITQPAVFAIGLGIAELWRSWGVRPVAVLGHSVGEYAAAVYAGALPLEDGLKLIAERARLMDGLEDGGAMAAVFCSEAAAREAIEPLDGAVSIAAVNGPTSIVLSGDAPLVTELLESFRARGIDGRMLRVSHAFHSRLVEPILPALRDAVASLRFAEPSLRIVSNLTGAPLPRGGHADPEYWVRHSRQAVRFGDGIRWMHEAGIRVFLECGPDATLVGMGARCLPDAAAHWIASLRPGRDDGASIASACATLYTAGVDLDWRERDRPWPRRRVDAPTTPFQRVRCWVPDRGGANVRAPSRALEPHPLLGERVRTPHEGWLFERTLRSDTLPFLADHVVRATVIVPAAAWIEAALAAAAAGPGWEDAALVDVAFMDALELRPDVARSLQITIDPPVNGRARFRVHSLADGEERFRLHAEGMLQEHAAGDATLFERALDAQCEEVLDPHALYEELRERGLEFGPAFRGVTALRRGGDDAIGTIAATEDDARYRIHPALLDAAIQVVGAAARDRTGQGELYMPVAVAGASVFPGAAAPVRSHARLHAADDQKVEATVRMYDARGRAVAVLDRLRFRRVPDGALPAGGIDAPGYVHTVRWEPSPSRASEPAQPPAPAALAAELDAALPQIARTEGTAAYDALLPDLDRLATAWCARALRLLGWTPAPGDIVDAATLGDDLNVLPAHRKLLARMLEFFAQDGLLEAAGPPGRWKVRNAPETDDPEALGRELVALHAPHDAELTVIQRVGAGLAAALVGEADPLDLIFPGGDTSAQARIYRDTPIARTFNGLIARAAAEAARTASPTRPLRILEVGAGTGGTTGHVLPALAGARVEYTFTDVGPLFVSRARDRFAAYRFARFATLDLERDPIEQGFEPGSFDMVLATNVVHATRDVVATLERLRTLLVPGGIVCAAEVTHRRRWLDLAVGLTPGWWTFDDALRTDSPLMDASGWSRAFTAAGFDGARVVTGRDGALHDQAVLLAASPATSGGWLVLADHGGVADAFVARLARSGVPAVVVPPSGPGSIVDTDRASFEELVRGLDPALTDVVTFRPLDADWLPGSDPAALEVALQRACASTLHLAQALVGIDGATPRMHIVTATAQAVASPLEHVMPAQSAVWGMARSITLEHPELRLRRIDWARGADEDALHHELLRPDDESEVALRGGTRYAPRVALDPAALADERPQTGRLRRGANGSLDDLTFEAIDDPPPGPDEVEIAVEAAGLNFRDVVHALGVRRDVDVLGTECVGRVLRVGSRVEHLTPGDLVAAAAGAIGERVTLHAGLVVRVPGSLTAVEAATIPIAFLTADLALREVGRMRSGEKILVHAAAGGVGMAAVQLARAAGLEVYGTASSPAKRARVLALGATECFDSRSTDFTAKVLEATNGRGVDLVLNSLTGEMIPASLRTLARGGRFLEVGKSEVWDRARAVALPGVQPEIEVHAVDLSTDLQLGPALVRPRLEAIMARVAAGELTPLPARVFPMSRASDAFREMAAARHAGKLVLLRDGTSPVRSDGTYLVSGGLAGLGLAVAERLAERGAGALVLLGRSDPDERGRAAIERIRARGTIVSVARADVADADALTAAVAAAGDTLPPLRGIVHSAGVLRDAALVQQRWEDVLEVLRPKAVGAAVLQRVADSAPIDFFVLFSSAAGMLGSRGQANHAAANAFLDGVAHDRVAAGRPAISIAWGAWSGIGAAVRHGVDVPALDPETGLQLFERLLRGAPPAVLAAAPQARASAPRPIPRPAADPERAAPDVMNRIGGLRGEARMEALRDWIEQCAAKILQLPAGTQIEPRRPLGELGLDSLLAVELRNVLGAGLGRTLPATLLFDHPSVEALAAHIEPQLPGAEEEVRPASKAQPETTDLLDRIESLSEDEVQMLLRGSGE